MGKFLWREGNEHAEKILLAGGRRIIGVATSGKYKTTTSVDSVVLRWRMQLYAKPEKQAETTPTKTK